MQYKSKFFSSALLGVFVFPIVTLLSYNLYIDPFQIIHADFENPDILLGGGGTERYQHVGVINQYRINAFVVGHSHVSNYLPSKISQEFGLSNIHALTMNGSSIYEQLQVARYALNKNEVEWVLWGFSSRNLLQKQNLYNKKFPLKEFLYDNNKINDLNFFLSFSLEKYYEKKKKLIDKIKKSKNNKEKELLEFDRVAAWFPKAQCHFNRPRLVANKIFKKNGIEYNSKVLDALTLITKKQLTAKLSKSSRLNYEGNLNKNILPLILKYPNTEFNFVVSVFPTAVEQRMKAFSKEKYLQSLLVLKSFVENMNKYSNVKIFLFGLEAFSDDLRLYKDSGHFHQSVNNFFLEKMANNEGIVNSKNINSYLIAFDKKVSSYRLPNKWNPKHNEKFIKYNYISNEVARLLINGKYDMNDEIVTEMSLKEENLPECVKKIKKIKKIL